MSREGGSLRRSAGARDSLGANISAKQRYALVVRVGEGGRIIAESMEKY